VPVQRRGGNTAARTKAERRTVVGQVAALRFFYTRTLKRQSFSVQSQHKRLLVNLDALRGSSGNTRLLQHPGHDHWVDGVYKDPRALGNSGKLVRDIGRFRDNFRVARNRSTTAV
jgi:hypothetical protein